MVVMMMCAAMAIETAPPTAAERFETLKTLAGTWMGDTDGDGTYESEMVYRVIAAGSAVHATMFPGTDHEMVNVFHLDGDDLLMTHYCAGGNQPHLKAAADTGAESVRFELVNVSNLGSPDAHFMGEASFTIVDANTLRETWTSFENRETAGTMEWELKRKEAMTQKPEAPEGMPAFVEYTVVLLRPVEDRPDLPADEAQEIQAQHLAHLSAMREKGMVFAGPFGDRSGGMCIYEGLSFDEVRALAESDPAVKAGRLSVHAHPWLVPGGLTGGE